MTEEARFNDLIAMAMATFLVSPEEQASQVAIVAIDYLQRQVTADSRAGGASLRQREEFFARWNRRLMLSEGPY